MNQYKRTVVRDDKRVIEYASDIDFQNITSVISVPINAIYAIPDNYEPILKPTVEEMQAQTLINTEYLIAMNEMGIQGGTV
ncbi:hypothetical protein [Lysinibacillus capsici]|uniref:hypothetical protein n=1 Tax=Lysinibacillus capsici TaxID=2115968 RepID=UPI002898526F|nr:hypothetical protein [Lysinibacillus capsici]